MSRVAIALLTVVFSLVRALVVFALVISSPAQANLRLFGGASSGGAPVAVVLCPLPGDNGCSTAQAYDPASTAVFLGANARNPGGTLNQLTGSPTNYLANGPNRNQAGIEYPVGSYLALSSLGQNVHTALPAATGGACVYSATGGAYGLVPQMTCTSTVAELDIFNWDFTEGGTTCIALSLVGNSGYIHVKGNNWKNNGACATNSTSGNIIQASSRTTATTLFDYNTLDGNIQNFPFDYYSPCAVPDHCNASYAMIVEGDWHNDHNVITGFSGCCSMQYVAANASVGWTNTYNYIGGCCTKSEADHAEMIKYGGTGTGHSWIGNTFILPTSHDNGGAFGIPENLGPGTSVPTTAAVNLTDNFYAVGGTGATTGFSTYSGTLDTSGVFTTSTVSGAPMASGMYTQCGTGTNIINIYPIYAGLTGSRSAGIGGGGNSSWTDYPTNTILNQVSAWQASYQTGIMQAGVDNGAGAAGKTITVTADPGLVLAVGSTISIGGVTRTISAMSPTTNPDTGVALTGSGTTGTYYTGASAVQLLAVGSVAMFPANPFPGNWAVPANLSCTQAGGSATLQPFSNTAWLAIGGSLNQVTQVGNYIDTWVFNLGAAVQITRGINGVGSTFTGITSVGGSILTITSANPNITIGWGLSSVGGTTPGAYVSAGTYPTYTLTGNSANVGPVSMNMTQAFCLNPTIWGTAVGDPNEDMSGNFTQSQMNAWSNVAAGNNCQ